MNRTRPYLNRFVKRKEQDIEDGYHLANLRQIKPMTTKLMEHSETIVINHRKAETIKEIKQIQIERENKLLLQKISRVMQTKGAYSVIKTKSQNTRTNKSLNNGYRKRQTDTIISQNKHFILRLQNKKPTLNLDKLRRDWVDNQNVIKRMANFEFNLTSMQSRSKTNTTIEKNYKNNFDQIRMSRIRTFKNHRMLVSVKVEDNVLKIIGDSQNNNDLKVIEIPKDEAIEFIQKECHGKLSILIDRIQYDSQSETMYLIHENIGQKDEDIGDYNPETNLGQRKRHIYQNKNIKMESTRKNRSSYSHNQANQEDQFNLNVPVRPSLEFKTAKISVNSFERQQLSNVNSFLDILPNITQNLLVNHIKKNVQQFEKQINHQQKSPQGDLKISKNVENSQKRQNVFTVEQAVQQKTFRRQIIVEPEQNENYEQQFEQNGENN